VQSLAVRDSERELDLMACPITLSMTSASAAKVAD
jgi:hypothetical protein